MNTLKSIFVFIVVLAAVSCNKNKNENANTEQIYARKYSIMRNGTGILTFVDQNDFATNIEAVNQMNEVELLSFQSNNSTYERYPFQKSGNEYKFKIYKDHVKLGPDINDTQSVHYAGYDEFGDTPSTDPATMSKYVYNLQNYWRTDWISACLFKYLNHEVS